MSFIVYVDDACPKCRKPIRRTTIERHPTRHDLAVHNFHCAACGPVKTKIISLKPGRIAA
jgi:hypothetical protein